MQKSDWTSYRKSLAVLNDGLFLNYAATAPLSRRSIEKIKAEAEEMQVPLGQRFYSALNNLENARRGFAELINAKGSEIAFTQNTSTAISTIAGGLAFRPGDRVLVADNEFPSNYYPWVNLQDQGVICEKFTPQKNVPIVETLKQLDLTNVKLVSLSAVSYHTGRLYELADFVAFCQENKILSCLDSIQAIGVVPFDVQKLEVDFVCSGAQKWLMGPVGCGIIYCREKWLEKLKVPYVGWTSVLYPENFDLGELEFSQEMTRFEPGLPNYLAVMGLSESMVELKQLGWSNIFSAIHENTLYLQSGLQSMGFELLTGEKDQVAGITSFTVPEGVDHRSVEASYAGEKIKITARNDYVRVSPHFFNTTEELDVFLNATEKIFKKGKQKNLVHPPKKVGIPQENHKESVVRGRLLLTGAAGHLGSEMAKQLIQRGYSLHLVDINQESLLHLVKSLEQMCEESVNKLTPQGESKDFNGIPSGGGESPSIKFDVVDFNNSGEFQNWLQGLRETQSGAYYALVHCAGLVETSLFQDLDPEKIKSLFEVNVSAPTLLFQAFLKDLKAKNALGVLNVVSSTGRCGSPLLSVYAATHAAMWTLGESLAREYADENLTITTYVAPAMHSPMQKRMGRISLRYFRMSGHFDYEVVENVAEEALRLFFQKEKRFISKLSRLKLYFNAFMPSLIDRKIEKVWRRDL